MRAITLLLVPLFLFAWLFDKHYIFNPDTPPMSMVDTMALVVLGVLAFHLYMVALFICIWYDVKNDNPNKP